MTPTVDIEIVEFPEEMKPLPWPPKPEDRAVCSAEEEEKPLEGYYFSFNTILLPGDRMDNGQPYVGCLFKSGVGTEKACVQRPVQYVLLLEKRVNSLSYLKEESGRKVGELEQEITGRVMHPKVTAADKVAHRVKTEFLQECKALEEKKLHDLVVEFNNVSKQYGLYVEAKLKAWLI